ncbi:hypothetical protein [Ruegeria arenilitoris]|uniref:hypothetical protein n=1 Tax=Ruegeria arenilitoris TaxID=1173585 RepID=UPI0014800745|nr:hypothetical protein [Ruegeria arenilitoris]
MTEAIQIIDHSKRAKTVFLFITPSDWGQNTSWPTWNRPKNWHFGKTPKMVGDWAANRCAKNLGGTAFKGNMRVLSHIFKI